MSSGLSAYLSMYEALIAIVRPAILIAIALGLWVALRRAGIEKNRRIQTWLAVIVPLGIWFAVIWVLAVNGAFELQLLRGGSILPLAITIPVVIGLFALTRSETIASAVDAANPSWLIGIQVYRLIGGSFLVLWSLGSIPGVFALPAGIGDMIVGLLALPTAFYLASGAAGGHRRAVIWNLLGMFDLALAITLGMLSSPGALQLLSLGHPNALIAAYPTVMTPAFAVPLSLILHGLSLWQLRRRAGRSGFTEQVTT